MAHDWNSIRTAYEAGEPWKALTEMGPAKSTISRRAKGEGWSRGNTRRNTPPEQPGPHAPARDNSTVDIEQRLATNTQAAARGVETGLKMIGKAEAIMDMVVPTDEEGEARLVKFSVKDAADLLKAAAQMQKAGVESITKSNAMTRLNAGLPRTYEKSETQGDLRVDYQPGQLREVAGRVFGFDFDGDNRPVSTLPD